MQLYNIQEVYNDFSFPREFLRIVNLNLVNFDWWYLLNKEHMEFRIKQLKERYPHRKLIPFARRDDGDDIACFEVGKGDKVQIVHDYSSPGYEQRKEYACFWDWFRDAIEEMINNDDEE